MKTTCSQCGQPAIRFIKRDGDLVKKGAIPPQWYGLCSKHFGKYLQHLLNDSRDYYKNRLEFKEITYEEYVVSEVLES